MNEVIESTKTIVPAKSISMATLFKKANIRQSIAGVNGRIGFSTNTVGFEISALDFDYREVYGTRNGKRVVVRWNKRQKKDTRFNVGYHGSSTGSFRYTDEQRAAARDAFAKMIQILDDNGYVVENIRHDYLSLTVVGKLAK